MASPPSKRTVVGGEPPRVEPVAVTSTETVRGSERGRLVEAVRESVNVASVPSSTLLPGAMVTTGVSGTSLAEECDDRAHAQGGVRSVAERARSP